jgi:two-component system chemotaxis sensor kinase CheA
MDAIRAGFFVECDDLLESLRDAIAAFESAARGQTRPDPETIHTAFRAVHSVKGGAAAFALAALVDFAHGLECRLEQLREAPDSPPPLATIDAMQRAADHLAEHIRAARDGTAPPAGDAPILAAFLAPAAAAEATGMQTLTFRPHDGLYASGNEPFFLLQALAGLGATAIRCDSDDLPGLDALLPERSHLVWQMELPADLAEVEIRDVFDFVEDLCDLTLSAGPPAAPPPPPATQASAPAAAAAPRPAGPAQGDDPAPTMRIALDRIDRLMNLVGELAINQSILSQQLAGAGLTSHAPLAAGLDALAGLTRDIQDGVMTMRAQPVKPLFQRMGGILRSTAASLGKPARLQTSGETTEIDRSVIDRLVDPLTHMIRNAVDHGLEPAAARRAAGKPAEGTITLSAAHRAGRVVIELSDDGGGIDRARVRAIARARGLIATDAAPTDDETDQLLFRPGFSTAGQVSDVSGRGVGLDVLRSAITGLGGRIAVSSEPGRGTRFTLSLPLTLAVLDGIVVRAGGQTLVVPVATALETAALRALDRRPLGTGPDRSAGPQLVRMQGGFAPLCDVAAILGYRPAAGGGTAGGAPQDRAGDRTGGGVVILTQAEDGRRAALLVDAILDQRQVVIKPIRGGLPPIPGIAAATILGDGHVALILDPAELAGAAAVAAVIDDIPREVV